MNIDKTENVLVTGANGQLGSELKGLYTNYPQWKFFFSDANTLDITDRTALDDFVLQNNIHFIINCAAYTNVDGAEDEVELSNAVNHLAVQSIAEVSKEKNIKLVHISTDYVFNGNTFKPYSEEDITDPVNAYGLAKLKGEEVMKRVNPRNSIIIRTSWVYSQYGHNFVKTMRRLFESRDSLNVIFDQIGTPTNAKDLGQAILTILPQISSKNVEVYHYSNEGAISWYDFAQAILEIEGLDCNLNPIRTEQYPTKATRPRYSVMDKSKIKERFNLDIPYWRNSLKLALSEIKNVNQEKR